MYNPNPQLPEVQVTPEITALQEQIAEHIHDVWAAGRIKNGWTYGPERNDQLKTHPDLVPYSELPEEEKQYDRDTAMNTIKLIICLGYKITKVF